MEESPTEQETVFTFRKWTETPCHNEWQQATRFGTLNHICLEPKEHSGPCLCCTCDEQKEMR